MVNNSCPWSFSNDTCDHDMTHFDTGIAPSIVSIVSCVFSCLGSFLIVLTFFVLKDMRTGSQKIITLLAIADLISAIGYIVGSTNYLHHRNMQKNCGNFNSVCVAQATVTSYSSLVSFLLTVILAFYFFLIIVFKRVKVASSLMVFYNIVAWGMPLAIVVPLLALGRLGYSHFAASNWCFVKDTHENKLSSDLETNMLILVAGKFWEILSYFVVSVLYVVITVYMGKTRRRVRNTLMEPRVIHVETRLLLIPVIFILLRIWGTLQFLFAIGTSSKISKRLCLPKPIQVTFQVIGILQAIGDGGQGWGNAVLYIFLSPIIRERLMMEWCGKCAEKAEDRLDHLGPSSGQPNNVQFRTGPSAKFSPQDRSYGSSETVPILSPGGGNRATGYNIRRYETTSAFASGTDASLT